MSMSALRSGRKAVVALTTAVALTLVSCSAGEEGAGMGSSRELLHPPISSVTRQIRVS